MNDGLDDEANDIQPPDSSWWDKSVQLVRSPHCALFLAHVIHQMTVTARIGAIGAEDQRSAALDHFRRHNEFVHGVVQELINAVARERHVDPEEWLEDRWAFGHRLGLASEFAYALEEAAKKVERM